MLIILILQRDWLFGFIFIQLVEVRDAAMPRFTLLCTGRAAKESQHDILCKRKGLCHKSMAENLEHKLWHLLLSALQKYF